MPASGSCLDENFDDDCYISNTFTPNPSVSCQTNCASNYGQLTNVINNNTGCNIVWAGCKETTAIYGFCQTFNQNAQTCVDNYNFLMEISDGEYASEAAAELAMCAAGIWEGYSESYDGAVTGYNAQVDMYNSVQSTQETNAYNAEQACIQGCNQGQ
jgi:hypothetical protein